MPAPGNKSREGVRLARNAGSSYLLRALLGLSALLLTPYLYRRLGAAGFGTWSVMFTLTTVFDLIQVGFSDGAIKYVSEHRVKGERGELQATVDASIVLMGLLGAFAFAGSAALGFGAAGLAPIAERHDFSLGMLVIGGAMLVRFPCYAYGAVLSGYQRFDLFYASQCMSAVVFALGAVGAVEAGTGVFGIAVAFAASVTLGGLLFIAFVRYVDPELGLWPRLGDRRTRARIFAFGSFSLLVDTMVFIAMRMDTVIIAAIRSAATAAPYAAALKLQSAVQSLTLPFMNLLMPMVSELSAHGRREEIFRRITLATRACAQITIPAATLLALFADDVVDTWLGRDAPEVTETIIVALMAALVVTLVRSPASQALIGIGRVRAVAALSVVEGIANLAVSVVLIQRYGAIGAALGTLTTSTLVSPVRYPILCRALGFSTFRFLVDSVGRAAVASAPSVVAMALVHVFLSSGGERLLLGSVLGISLALATGLRQVGSGRIVGLVRPGGMFRPERPALRASDLE